MSSCAAAASRARGSLILGIFGSLWLAGAVSIYANTAHAPAAAVAAVASIALAAAVSVLVVAWRTAARLRRWSEPWPVPIARAFWIVNLASIWRTWISHQPVCERPAPGNGHSARDGDRWCSFPSARAPLQLPAARLDWPRHARCRRSGRPFTFAAIQPSGHFCRRRSVARRRPAAGQDRYEDMNLGPKQRLQKSPQWVESRLSPAPRCRASSAAAASPTMSNRRSPRRSSTADGSAATCASRKPTRRRPWRITKRRSRPLSRGRGCPCGARHHRRANVGANAARRLAQVAARLSDARYRVGVASFLDALISQRAAYSAQQQLVITRLNRDLNLVELYRSLGGGLS